MTDTELKPCREAFEKWWENDETLQDSGIEIPLAIAKDLMWLGYVAAWNRRSGDGECMPELGTVMALSILETRCAVTEGMYHALRTAVEQVRDEIRDRPMRFGVKYRVKDELNLIVDTLTRILDDDETETDKFKRKTKPITTRIGKD